MNRRANNKKRRRRMALAVLALVVLAGGIALRWYNQVASRPNPLARSRRAALEPLASWSRPDAVIQAHLSAYQLAGSEDMDVRVGVFRSGGIELAGYAWRPSGRIHGTVVLVHGYLGHTGAYDRFIRALLRAGWAVAAFDLPGHGLSGGVRGSIGAFGQYSAALADFMTVIRERLAGPYHLVAHSTGAAAVLQYLLEGRKDDLGVVVLVAPLVRNYAWRLSQIGVTLADGLTEWVPRVFRASSSDQAFLARQQADPLQVRHLPLAWNRALRQWLAQLEDYCPVRRKLLVIQGTADTVVDWRYNLARIESLVDGTTVYQVADGRHELLNEAKAIREEVFGQILAALAAGGPEDPGQ